MTKHGVGDWLEAAFLPNGEISLVGVVDLGLPVSLAKSSPELPCSLQLYVPNFSSFLLSLHGCQTCIMIWDSPYRFLLRFLFLFLISQYCLAFLIPSWCPLPAGPKQRQWGRGRVSFPVPHLWLLPQPAWLPKQPVLPRLSSSCGLQQCLPLVVIWSFTIYFPNGNTRPEQTGNRQVSLMNQK